MFRIRILCLLMALIATQALRYATSLPAHAPVQAFASTRTARASTQDPPGAHQAPHVVPNASANAYSSTGDDYTTHSLTMQEEMLLNLINQDRISASLPPLIHDPELSRIARIKSADMLTGDYFAHESPKYGKARQMLTHFGYNFRGCGENIARHATVAKAQAAFMTSEGHRRNILSANWQKVGVGVVLDENGHVYATQLFVR